jgi:hypothetical protein
MSAKCPTKGCNFFILGLLKKFIDRAPRKLIPYMDPGKGARLDGVLGSLKGARLLGALSVHMGVGTVDCRAPMRLTSYMFYRVRKQMVDSLV